MTRAAQGDVVQLVTAGVAAANGNWRGGRGLLIIADFNAGATFQIQAPDGTWVDVKDIASSAAINTAANASFNFELPAGPIRMSAGGGTMDVWAVGV